jgi:hypothetical protein
MTRPAHDFHDPSAISRWEHCCVPYALALLHTPEVRVELVEEVYRDRCMRLQEHTRNRKGFHHVSVSALGRLLKQDYHARHLASYAYDETAPTLRRIAWRRGFRRGTFLMCVSHDHNRHHQSHAVILRDQRVHDNHTSYGMDFGVNQVRVHEIWEIPSVPWTRTHHGTYDSHGMRVSQSVGQWEEKRRDWRATRERVADPECDPPSRLRSVAALHR